MDKSRDVVWEIKTGVNQPVVLISKEGVAIETTRSVCLSSEVLKGLLEELPDDQPLEPIPIDADHYSIMRALAFMKDHMENPMPEIERPLKSPLIDIVGPTKYSIVDIGDANLYSLLLAANYMNCGPLLSLAQAKVAADLMDMAKANNTGNKTEAFQKRYNLYHTMTPEEIQTLRDKFTWTFHPKKNEVS